ncbi:MAG: hypothetical protein ACXVCP_18125 [Bdellovibrio sp.]
MKNKYMIGASSTQKNIQKVSFYFTGILLVISLLVFISSLWHRAYHIDDIWLAEYSFWLQKLGYVKSEAARGYFNAENKFFAYHKFFAIEGAWIIDLFGFKPYALKAIGLIYTVLCLPLLAIIYKRYSSSGKNLFLVFALFLSFFHTVNLGFTFRPELNLAFLFLLSFILLDNYIRSGKQIYLLASAFFGGLSIATHLNGCILVGASVLYMWFQRRWLTGFIFGAVASWGLFFYFLYDVSSWNELVLSYNQLMNWRDVSTGKYGFQLFFRLIQEQGRYLHSPPEILYTLMLVLIFTATRKSLYKSYKNFILFVGLLFFCTAEITHGTNTNYLMCSFPFFILLAVLGFEKLLDEGKIKMAWVSVLIFLIGSWSYNLVHFKHREQLAPEYTKLAEFLPRESQVLAPKFLMFDGLGKFHIQDYANYIDKVEQGLLKQTPEDLFNEALKFNIEYVVLDQQYIDFFHVKPSAYGPYTIDASQPSKFFTIYKKGAH